MLREELSTGCRERFSGGTNYLPRWPAQQTVPSSVLTPARVSCFQACAISGLFNCITIHPLNIAAGVWMM